MKALFRFFRLPLMAIGIAIELMLMWRNFELVNSEEIYFCPKCGRDLTEAK